MSRMLSKMNLISVVQQLPKEDIEIVQGYIGMIEEENKQLKDKIPYIIQNNSCKYISIEKCKNKVCVNYKMQELQGSDK